MICKGCGMTLSEGVDRCPYCGSRVEPTVKAASKVAVAVSEKGGEDIFSQAINSVLEITAVNGNMTSAGSGFMVSEDGYALTNCHVVVNDRNLPSKQIAVRVGGAVVEAKVVSLGDNKGGRGSGIDLALIKLMSVPEHVTIATLGDSDKVKTGEKVFVIGNSLGRGTCMTAGIVSDSKRRATINKYYIMTDCAINGGNSGGPMFNADGEVIGIVVARGLDQQGNDAEGMNYAIPSNDAREFMKQIIK